MRNVLLAAFVLGLGPSLAGALEIKNVRPTHGPNGALRSTLKLLPGDFVFLSYDIDGLKVNPKTGKVSYEYTLELLDPSMKTLFKKNFPVDMILQFGGTQVPGDSFVQTVPKQAPGMYTIKVTVKDKLGETEKAITYPYELLKEDFGFAGIVAPAVGLPGMNTPMGVSLAYMTLDKKNQPNVEIVMRILDEAGKPVAQPIFNSFPADLPAGVDLTKDNSVPLNYPLTPNRPGRFTIEILAKEKGSMKEAQFRYTMVVLDMATVSAK